MAILCITSIIFLLGLIIAVPALIQYHKAEHRVDKYCAANEVQASLIFMGPGFVGILVGMWLMLAGYV